MRQIIWMITSVCLRERQRETWHAEREGDNMSMEAKMGQCCHKPTNSGSHLNLEEAIKEFCPRVYGSSAALPTP